MDDPLLVRRRQPGGSLKRVVGGPPQRQGTAGQAVAQGLPLQQFRDDIRRAFVGSDVKDSEDIGMVQRPCGSNFQLETPQPVRVAGHGRGQNFDRHFPSDAGVAGAIDFPHPPRAQRRDNFIRTELCPRRKGHRLVATARISPYTR